MWRFENLEIWRCFCLKETELKPLQNPFFSNAHKCRPNFSFLQVFLLCDYELFSVRLWTFYLKNCYWRLSGFISAWFRRLRRRAAGLRLPVLPMPPKPLQNTGRSKGGNWRWNGFRSATLGEVAGMIRCLRIADRLWFVLWNDFWSLKA